MALNSSLLMLLAFISLYLTIIEIFTVLFRLTGMTTDRARFQVISMLTNSGFTTAESETIMSSRKRRTLAMNTMLFGYTFTVVIVSSLLNVIIRITTDDRHTFLNAFVYIGLYIMLLFVIRKIPLFTSNFDKFVRYVATRVMYTKNSNRFIVLDIFGNSVLGELVVAKLPDELVDKTIAEAGIREKYGVSILTIARNGITNPSITPTDILRDDDRLVMFGPLENISSLFNCALSD